ncbi:MAG: RbsD/FucU domain-containing protein [Beijerinckiaceae bacterium]
MLKGLDPLLTPDLLWVLASMGHGDDLALVDSNHPAETIARATTSGRLVRLPGVAIDRAAQAILSVYPLDAFVDDPVRRMQVVGKPDEIPEIQKEVAAIAAAAGFRGAIASIERFAFYDAARKAFAVVQAGDPRPYGCFLLRKGVIAGEKP